MLKPSYFVLMVGLKLSHPMFLFFKFLGQVMHFFLQIVNFS
ncbi:hypothetical protein IMCC9480_779 [Oxalobacteraceae bacterium IMCC9480]|nr:hypothetical protein IMCC9480_779 [Oxalobacteraceae bacterium IMCC9480]